MITEVVESLDQVLCQAEVVIGEQFLWAFEYVGHLQGYGLDKAFGMLGEVAVLR